MTTGYALELIRVLQRRTDFIGIPEKCPEKHSRSICRAGIF